MSWSSASNATSYDVLRNSISIINTTATSYADRGFGNALSFDGSNDYVNVANSPSLQVTGDLTVSFWAYPTNIAKGRQNPVGKAYGGEFNLTMETNGSLSYYHGSAGGNAWPHMSCSTAGMFSNNTRVNVTIVRNVTLNTIKVYKNGALQPTSCSSWVNPSASTRALKIGYEYAGYWQGIIDEVKIFNKDLSANVTGLYDGTYNDYGGLAGLWHFDEGNGQAVSDSSNSNNNGYANNGTLGGTSAVASDDPSWIQNGLQWQSQYSWQVRATGPGGSTLSNTTNANTIPLCPPTKPGLVLSTFCDAGTNLPNVTLRWSYTTATTKYEIYRQDAGLIKTINQGDPEFSSRTWTDTNGGAGLDQMINYIYYIVATGPTGLTNQSDSISVITPGCSAPSQPKNLTASFTCLGSYPRVNLNWNASANATSYTIYRSPAGSPFPVTTALASYTDTAITTNTNYSYYVVAYGPGGASPPSDLSSLKTGYCLPSTPSITSLTTGCESNAPVNTVSWSDATPYNTFEYKIYRNTTNSPPATPIKTLASTSPEFSSRSWKDNLILSPLTTYYYWVKASGPVGESAYSSSKFITTYSCGLTPNTPTLNLDNLFCQDNLPYAALSWNSVANAYSYNLYRTNPDLSQSIYSTRRSVFNEKGSSALSFDGVDDYARAASALTLTDFSIELWMNPGTKSSGWRTMIGGTSGWELNLNNNNYFINVYSQGQLTSTFQLTIGQWYHVVVTRSSIGTSLYINGVLNQSNANTNTISNVTFQLGRWATSQYYQGLLDDVRIYGRALSASEVTDHYNGVYKNESELRTVWHIDDISGTTASDQSGNNNNLALYNGPAWQTDSPNVLKVISLERSKDYNYRVKAFGADTESDFSSPPISFSTPSCLPAKPDLVVDPKCDINNNSYIQLSWSSDINTVSWKIYKNGVTIVPATTETSYSDTDITPGSYYTYAVFAAGVGVPSTPSDLIGVTASLCTKDPSKPSVTAAAACYGYSSRARLDWQTDPLNYTLSYNVWRKNITLGEADFTKIESNLPATQIKYLDNLVPIQNDLSYKLEAIGEAKNIFSDDSNQITTLDCSNLPPNPPVLSNDPPISTGDYIGVVVYWTDAGNEEEYRLFRREIEGTWNQIIQLPANEDPTGLIYYADSAVSGLEDNKNYEYVAVAYNKNKPYDEADPIYSGSFSNFLPIFIPTAKPGNFTLDGAWQDKKIKLDWTPPASTSAGGSVTFKAVRSNSPAFDTTYIPACQDISELQCTDNAPSLYETFYKVIAQNNGGTTDSNIINMALPQIKWKEVIPW